VNKRIDSIHVKALPYMKVDMIPGSDLREELKDIILREKVAV
jgi:hypothetical protein